MLCMEKRWWQYEPCPRSSYLRTLAAIFGILSLLQASLGNFGLAAGYAAGSAFHFCLSLLERRKEKAGRGTLA